MGEKEHHIWCDLYDEPFESCWICKLLHKKYPMKGLTSKELVEKYFPSVVRR